MADPNEAGGWVIDPSNPNRATYTDEDKVVHEIWKKGYTPPAAAPAAPVQKPRTDISGNVLPEAGAGSAEFNDPTNPLKAAATDATLHMQNLLKTNASDDEIRQYAADVEKAGGGFKMTGVEEGLEARRRNIPVEAALDPRFNNLFNVQPKAAEKGRTDGLSIGVDALKDAAQHGFPGLLARSWYDVADAGKDKIRQMYPNMSEDQIEQMQSAVVSQAQRVAREGNSQQLAADMAGPGLLKYIPWLVGQVLGSGGPEMAFNPGASAVQRVIAQAGAAAVSDAAYQAADVHAGVADDFDPTQVGLSALTGAALQGGVFEPISLLRGDRASVARQKAEREALPDFMDVGDTKASVTPAPGRLTAYESKVVENARVHVAAITKDWKNAPAMNIVKDWTHLADGSGIDPHAVGVFNPETGEVNINLKNVVSQAKAANVSPNDVLTAATFHESLGHHGLSQKFGEDLGAILAHLDDSSPSFKAAVDKWEKENPHAYDDAPDPRSMAAEEVLAEMSQDGTIPAKTMDRFKNWIKTTARTAGMDMEVSPREVKTILGMAHDAVVNGKPNDVVGNGLRYMYGGENAITAPRYDDPRWFRAPDGKSRFEISDHNSVFDEKALAETRVSLPESKTTAFMPRPLHEILKHDELFNAYPELRDVDVTSKGDMWDFGKSMQGWYDAKTNTVNITPYAKDKKSTLLHEIQHWIQNDEGFARGGNDKTALSKMSDDHLKETAENVLNYRQSEFERETFKYNAFKTFQATGMGREWKALRDNWQDAAKLQQEAMKKAKAENPGVPAYQIEDFRPDLKRMRQWSDEQSKKYWDFENDIFKAFGVENPSRADKNQMIELKAAFVHSNDPDLRLSAMEKDLEAKRIRLDKLSDAMLEGRKSPLVDALSKDDTLSFQAYQSLFGEVEARDVQARMDMDEEARRESAPYSSQAPDHNRSSYVFDYGDDVSKEFLRPRLPFSDGERTGKLNREEEALRKDLLRRDAERRWAKQGTRFDEDQQAVDRSTLKYMRVWHGTPKDEKFDAFDHTYMGSGEGAQVYGWGTYLTEVKQIADDFYRRGLSSRSVSRRENGEPRLDGADSIDDWLSKNVPYESVRNPVIDALFADRIKEGKPVGRKAAMSAGVDLYVKKSKLHPEDEKLIRDMLMDNDSEYPTNLAVRDLLTETVSEIRQLREEIDANPPEYTERFDKLMDDLERQRTLRDTLKSLHDSFVTPTGSLYEVELPDNATWLLNDKPLAEQPKLVRDFFREQLGENKERINYWSERVNRFTKEIADLEKNGEEGEFDNLLTGLDPDPNLRDAEQRYLDAQENLYEAQNELRSWKNPTGQDLYNMLRRKLGTPKAASEAMAKAGIEGNKYLTGMDRARGEGSYNYVVFSDKTPKIVNKYMRKFRNGDDEGMPKITERVGGVNLENIASVGDLDHFMARAYDDFKERNPGFDESVPRAETERLARDLKLTPSKLVKGKDGTEGLAARTEAGMQVLVNQLKRVEDISNRFTMKGNPKDHFLLMKEMATLSAVYGRVSSNNSEVGRALGILNKMREATSMTEELMKYMRQHGATLYSNPANIQQLAQTIQNTASNAAKIKIAKQSFKPRAEDYLFRVYYNMMLSNPATHSANFMGTGANFVVDLMENTGAAIAGQYKRFSNADRIRGREVAYRVYGALRGFMDGTTWANTRKSLNSGETGNTSNSKTGNSRVYTGSNPVAGFMSGLAESPTRMLAGADEWWRNVLQASNIHGLAVRNAGNKGLRGQDFWDEVDRLVTNPTKEMVEATDNYTKVLQFMDKPSWIARGITNWQTPGPNAGAVERTAKGVLKFAVPFVNTPDSLIRTSIRRSLLGFTERENIEGWKAGGAERDKVKARMIMASALAFWVSAQAFKGNITGAGPQNYKKNAEWSATHLPNSVRIGDEFHSIAGLEPVSTNINAIATLVERGKAGELSGEGYSSAALAATLGIAKVLSQNSYVDSMQQFMEIGSDDKKQQSNALQNFIAGQAASLTTPAILRKYTQDTDPAVRDTTGDGSFGDRVEGRIMAGVPGLSEQLPQKSDVLGRLQTKEFGGPDIMSRSLTKASESEPVVKEIKRLGERTSDIVFGAPSKSNIKVDGVQRRLTATEFQRYQRLSGFWAVESLKAEMQTDEWKASGDAERIATVKDVVKEMRKNAREYLFPETDDEDPDTKNEE